MDQELQPLHAIARCLYLLNMFGKGWQWFSNIPTPTGAIADTPQGFNKDFDPDMRPAPLEHQQQVLQATRPSPRLLHLAQPARRIRFNRQVLQGLVFLDYQNVQDLTLSDAFRRNIVPQLMDLTAPTSGADVGYIGTEFPKLLTEAQAAQRAATEQGTGLADTYVPDRS